MNVEVNYLAVVLAMVSSMVVGSIWYAKSVFGAKWMKLVNLDEKKMAADAPKAIGVTVVVSLLTAFVLAHMSYIAHQFYQNSFLYDSLVTGFWLWLGFTAARFVTHDAFERRNSTLTLMNVAHELVTIEVMALIIGLLSF